MSAADRDSVVGVGPSCAVPMPRSATRPAQYGWFTTWSTTTWGAPARVAVVVVPAPPWCTTAAGRPNSACWLTSPTAKQRRPAEWHHRHADTGQPLREVLVRWRAPHGSQPMPRRLTGFTPSGSLHLGNYLGAMRPIIAEQAKSDTVVFISDLHALTLLHDPVEVRQRTVEFATLLLAAGLDPNACLFLIQSQVPEHTELHYLLECVTGYGEAHRMIQFKDKARRQQQVRMSLLTYPILMAADILLYDTDEVPVGEDQRQHVELARDLATAAQAIYRNT